MIKRELKANLKSFIIWTSILVVLYAVVIILYPHIVPADSMDAMKEMMQIFPEEILKAFNMDIDSMSSAYGWLSSEGFTLMLLATGVYASLMGASIVLKEESDKTIEYLGMLPVKRSQILTNKIIVALVYIVGLVLLVGFVDYLALLTGEFNSHLQYWLLSLTPLLIALPFFAINLFISMFLHKTKATIGISLGVVFISYVINVLSLLSDKVEFLKYFSIHTLADTMNVVKDTKLNPIMVIISLVITILFIGLSYIRYNKKELV